MRFLLRVVPRGGDRGEFLRIARRLGANLAVRVVNPKWTSYGGLEVDVFAGTKADFETFTGALEPLGRIEFAKDLQEPQSFLSKADAVREAVSLFDAERFWEAHEVLESRWRVAEGDEKRLLQGLILVCAALVHHQKGEPEVAIGILERATHKLVWDNRHYYGIDVEKLRSLIARMLEERKVSVFKV